MSVLQSPAQEDKDNVDEVNSLPVLPHTSVFKPDVTVQLQTFEDNSREVKICSYLAYLEGIYIKDVLSVSKCY